MEEKSFGIGMAVASAIWVTLIAMLSCNDVEPQQLPGYPCDKLILEAKVSSYESGYFACLQDADSVMYTAYLEGRSAVVNIEEQEVIDSIVFDLAAKYNLNDDKREYLYTLITD